MEVNFLGNKKEYLNTIENTDIFLDELTQLLEQNKLYLSAINIDGIEIYDHFRESILESLSEVRSINIIAITMKQLADETLLSLSLYLTRVLSEMKNLITEFYQGVGENTWSRFSQFLDGIQWIISGLQGVIKIEEQVIKVINLNELLNQLSQQIIPLNESMAFQDHTLIADILNFDILPILKKLSEETSLILDSEVAHDI